MKFRFHGSLNNQKQSGVVESTSETGALRKLNRQGIEVFKLKQVKDKKARKYAKAKLKDYRTVLVQLVTLLSSGVPLKESLQSLTSSSLHPEVREKFKALSKSVTSGMKFSESLESAGFPFPPYVVQLARAGELTGNLASALTDACERMNYEEELRKEFVSALIYPSILIVVGILAVLFIFISVVPKFTGMLDRAEELPFLAWAVLSAGRFFNENNLAIAGVSGAIFVLFLTYIRNPIVREGLYERSLKMPVLGTWLLKSEVAKWSGLLSILLLHKVPLVDALNLSAGMINSAGLRSQINKMTIDVSQGTQLHSSMANCEHFEATAVEMIKVGERSGKLSEMLKSLGDMYRTESQDLMKRLLTLIEPAAIIIIGGMVGVIMSAVIMAITSVNNLGV